MRPHDRLALAQDLLMELEGLDILLYRTRPAVSEGLVLSEQLLLAEIHRELRDAHSRIEYVAARLKDLANTQRSLGEPVLKPHP